MAEIESILKDIRGIITVGLFVLGATGTNSIHSSISSRLEERAQKRERIESAEVERAIRETVITYADSNGDRIITPFEEEDFYKKLLLDKNAFYISGRLFYQNGKPVRQEDFNKWVNEYRENKK